MSVYIQELCTERRRREMCIHVLESTRKRKTDTNSITNTKYIGRFRFLDEFWFGSVFCIISGSVSAAIALAFTIFTCDLFLTL